MAEINYYDILMVNGNTSKDQIKKSYCSLAKKYLSNRNKFIQITEAYSVLSDENNRKLYDMEGYDAIKLIAIKLIPKEDIFKTANLTRVLKGIVDADTLFDMLLGGTGVTRSSFVANSLLHSLNIEHSHERGRLVSDKKQGVASSYGKKHGENNVSRDEGILSDVLNLSIMVLAMFVFVEIL